MTKTESGRATASPIAIVQEISALSENSDLQLASVAALLDQFGSAQKEKLSKLKARAEFTQKEFSDIQKALSEARATCLQAERDREDTKLALAGSQSEYQASQARATAGAEELSLRSGGAAAGQGGIGAGNGPIGEGRNHTAGS